MKQIFLMIYFAFFIEGKVLAQITLQPMMPASGLIQKNHLWNLLIISNSNEVYNCRLELILRDKQTGLESLTASSGQFNVGKGSRVISESLIQPVQYNNLSAGADNNFQGLIACGNYTACYSLFIMSLKEERVAEECISFDVEPLSPPMLTFPSDSSILDAMPTQFSWIPPTPTAMLKKLHYEIVFAEIRDGQQPAEAIQENLPFYNAGDLYRSAMTYPGSSQAFLKDKWYVWQVVARDDKSYSGKSEAWTFKVQSLPRERSQNDAMGFVKLNSANMETAVALNGILKIAYNNEWGEKQAKIEIVELGTGSSSVVSFNVKLTPGENLIQSDLTKLMQLSEEKTYEMRTINKNGAIVKLKFIVKYAK